MPNSDLHLLHYQALWLPKQGHAAEEYEDAQAAEPAKRAFAVADGATESSFAVAWAQLLVRDFVQQPTVQPAEWSSRLPALQQQWSATLTTAPLPWYAEAKLEVGAFATFLGLVIEDGTLLRPARWRAIAVGDSCLFHLRRDKLRTAFPVTASSEFGNNPWLVGSRAPVDGLLKEERVRIGRGRWLAGDQFWLMTDALAHWFIRRRELQEKPWEQLRAVLAEADPQCAFATFVQERRTAGDMRNDDVTLLAVEM